MLGRAATEPHVDRDAARAAGVEVLRRRSGGGPVLWDAGLLALDVVLPRGHRLAGEDVVAAYRWLGEAVAGALRALGVPDVAVLSPAEARADPGRDGPAAAACFGGRSPYEVLAGGRKVVGLSQARRRQGALFQAGILLGLDVAGLAGLLTPAGPERDAFAADLAARAGALPGPDAPSVIAAVEAELAAREGVRVAT
ncbi:MAG: lipoate---protein ligase [Miltoncostaeaceae bacterium]|nr:lipoate---protein ligase [Miltoncostaeaceae bacterium]